ncbi:uncharacterized protein LOC113316636 [Papaver somniferum]|uniref:uncharacterized protein LOC113316636 n=1 Tax=Papaver somniferum TaxID=3469 RepID=UPI000E6FFFA2|nr:uncharacterized protein LOC113316636 [Papaver somniferum]
MESWSASGPEGFQAGFYKSQWSIVGNDVCGMAAYVLDRLINDNTIIAHELIHSMKRKEGEGGWLALKLDMSKDFDILEWPFLLKVLQSFGFCEDWCQLIKQCISTTSLSVILNGLPCDEFSPTRGIRQGDHPYLFIIAMEWFSRTLLEAHNSKAIKGILVARGAPPINHLLFADDYLIFTQDNSISVNNLLQVLKDFSSQSGQVINFDESSVFYSNNVNPSVKAFEDIQLAFERRLGNWQGINLHQAGGTTMVKVVLNDVPMYQMSTFKIPKTLIKKLDSLQRKFWDLEMLNHALLTKIAWRICQNSDHLLTKILKAKYFKKEEFLHIEGERSNSSWTWKGIELGLSILQQNYNMEVNNGKGTKIWIDRWIIGLDIKVEPLHPSHLQYVFVSEPILPESNRWNIPLLNIFSNSYIVDRIKDMHLSQDEQDIVRWSPSKDGIYFVKTTYNKLIETRAQSQVSLNDNPTSVWKALWKMKLPHRVKLFIWKCLKNIVPTRVRLSQDVQNAGGDDINNWRSLLMDILDEASVFKFFVETSFDQNTDECGFGIVLYNVAGARVGFKGSHAAGIIDAEAGECRAVIEGLKWAKAMELDRIHLVADAETVVNSINNGTLSVRWENRKIIQEIKLLLKTFNFF